MMTDGEAAYYVIGVLSEDDRNNQPFIDRQGNKYQKLKFIVKDKNGETDKVCYNIYNNKIIVDICKSIGDQELLEEARDGSLNFEKLIGKGGTCLIVNKYVKQKNRVCPSIACWMYKVETDSNEESF